MRKEFIVAVFLGLTVGLLIVVGMLVARQAFEKHQAKPAETTDSNSPLISPSVTSTTPISPTPTPSKHLITIDQPENNSVVSANELMISGKTTPKSTIAIASEKNEYFTESDETGLFSQKVILINGVNEIKLSSLSPTEEQAETTLTIVYTTAEF